MKRAKIQGKLVDHSDNIYKAIFENSIDAIFITTPDGGIQSANLASCKMFGRTEEEIRKIGRNGILDLSDERLPGLLKERERTGKVSGELRYKRKDGSIFPADFTSTLFKFDRGKEFTITIVRDISSRKLLENKLVESEKNLRALIDAVDDSLFLMEPDGNIILANNQLSENFGKNIEDVVGTNTYKLVAADVAARRKKMVDRAISEGCPVAFTDQRADIYIENRVFPVRDESGKVTRLAIYGRDITLQIEAEQLLSASNEILGRINRASSKIDLIESVTGFLRNTFGFEAVGIRLKDGDDYPYYLTSGFPEDFVLKEKSLCSYDTEGELLRDSDGNTVLECMCGNIICGRYDPAKPFFTENGSFWSNSTSELLASTSEDDRQSRTRNRCNGEGYESVGLFPLRSGNNTVGLLQVNDHRKGIFTPARISLLEILGDNISIALDKFSAEEALKKSEDNFRMLVNLSPSGIYMTDANGNCIFVNEAWCRMAGMLPEEAYGDGWINAIHPNDRSHVSNLWKIYVQSGKEWNWSYRFRDKKGNIRWIYGLSRPVLNKDGEIMGFLGTNTDITERKKVETDRKRATENLKQSEEKYRLLSEQSGVGVGLYSKDGIILYYNSRALENLGGKSEDYIGKSLLDVFGKKDGNKYLKRVKKAIRLNENLVFEDHITSPTGNYWFASSHSLFSNSNGEVIGVQVVSHDITERKLIESQLIQTTTELRELTRHLVEVREKERTAIARDLHDDLGQKLTALNMDISWLKARIGVQSRTVENKIKQMIQMMNNTIESVQKISFGLRPSILDDLGLIPAIEWQLTDFHRTSGISCNYSCSPNNITVGAGISLVVFRIIQEALTNIARHSGATEVGVKINLTKGILEILIKDNGSGIEKEKIDSSKSYGLIGMRERVILVSGEVTITGTQGKGTSVHVRIPVE